MPLLVSERGEREGERRERGGEERGRGGRQGREAEERGRGESSSYNYPTANLLHVSGPIANKL